VGAGNPRVRAREREGERERERADKKITRRSPDQFFLSENRRQRANGISNGSHFRFDAPLTTRDIYARVCAPTDREVIFHRINFEFPIYSARSRRDPVKRQVYNGEQCGTNRAHYEVHRARCTRSFQPSLHSHLFLSHANIPCNVY